DHSGRPGASYPTAGGKLAVRGGLAGVYARDLTREAIWEALRARRCFATTGERMVLCVTARERWMGERTAACKAPEIQVLAIGTRPLESVEVLRGTEVLYRYPLARPGRRVRVVGGGARGDARGGLPRWDGGLTLSHGRIVSVEPWGFDLPSEGIVEQGARSLAWRSGTSGDPDGVTLDLDAPDEAEIHLRAG